jgi:excisionase family DNA binding protein
MVDSSDSFQLVSVAEAARILRVSDSTVRRLLKAGQLEARRVQRPQGHVWLVKVPAPATDPSEDPPRQIGAADADQPPPSTSLPPAEAMVSLIQTTIATVLGPLVGQLDAQRQTIERQAGELREMERELGKFAAERAAAEARYVALEARTAPKSAESTPEPWWHAWALWVFFPLMITIGIVLASLFLRG